jgi:hypothetical protein
MKLNDSFYNDEGKQTRPAPNTITGRVWEIVDMLIQLNGDIPSRQLVIDACSLNDIDASTASTQFNRYMTQKLNRVYK